MQRRQGTPRHGSRDRHDGRRSHHKVLRLATPVSSVSSSNAGDRATSEAIRARRCNIAPDVIVGSPAAGGDNLSLSAGPVVDDLGSGDGQGIVGIDVVEVAEAQQDVVDRLLRVLRLEALDKQR